MKTIKRITVTFASVLFLIGLVPVSSFAVDPISAATMSNALAQAITAYGASQGVSMTYDVANTDGIGEGVHDLWDQFKEDINDNNVPTYDSFAVTVWSSLFSKVNDHVAINLDATSVSFLDQFWNWLLSGPAEMTKVDDQYYEWTVNQDNFVSPISVYSAEYTFFNGIQVYSLPRTITGALTVTVSTTSGDPYNLTYRYSSNGIYIYSISPSSFSNSITMQNGTQVGGGSSQLSNGGWYWNRMDMTASTSQWQADISGSNSNPSIDDILGPYQSDSIIDYSDGITIRPYIGDTVPQDVYIPDNEDVNYEPLPYVGELDFPWSDSLYGDGTGSLTDAQSDAITSDLSDAITQSDVKTLELADTAPAPGPGGTEVYIPLLPVTIPSFNFSFSGIWHYVVSWVQSLGSWMTMMFTVWSNLPYAIVIPVYASAVVVIIIGTLKRFL